MVCPVRRVRAGSRIGGNCIPRGSQLTDLGTTFQLTSSNSTATPSSRMRYTTTGDAARSNLCGCQGGDCAVTKIQAQRDNVPAAKRQLNSRYTDSTEMICNCVFQRTILPGHFISAATYLQGAQRSKNAVDAATGQQNEQRKNHF